MCTRQAVQPIDSMALGWPGRFDSAQADILQIKHVLWTKNQAQKLKMRVNLRMIHPVHVEFRFGSKVAASSHCLVCPSLMMSQF